MNYPCPEEIAMVPKMFEPLKYNCTRKTRIQAKKHVRRIFQGKKSDVTE